MVVLISYSSALSQIPAEAANALELWNSPNYIWQGKGKARTGGIGWKMVVLYFEIEIISFPMQPLRAGLQN